MSKVKEQLFTDQDDAEVRKNKLDDFFSDVDKLNEVSKETTQTKSVEDLIDAVNDKDSCEICQSTDNVNEIPTGLGMSISVNSPKLCEEHATKLKLNEIQSAYGKGDSIIEQELYAKRIVQAHIQNKLDNDIEADRLLDHLHSYAYELVRPKKFVKFTDHDIEKLGNLKNISPNCASFFEYIQFSLFASKTRKKGKRRITPILLVGKPGVGKTFSINLLAKTLNIGFQSLQVSTMQSGGEFSGLSSKWKTPSLGGFTHALMQLPHQTGIILLDELDKTSESDHGSIFDSLLHLLEEDSCNTFQNDLIELPLITEDIIWIASANTHSLNGIPPQIISRFHIINIENLDAIQAKAIFNSIYEENCKVWEQKGYQCKTIDNKLFPLINNLSIRDLKQVIDLAVKKSAYKNQKNKIIALTRADFIDDHVVHNIFSEMSKNTMELH